jgi:hypothetical protein
MSSIEVLSNAFIFFTLMPLRNFELPFTNIFDKNDTAGKNVALDTTFKCLVVITSLSIIFEIITFGTSIGLLNLIFSLDTSIIFSFTSLLYSP